MALIYERGRLALKSEIKTGTSMKTGNAWQMQTIVVDIAEYGGQFRKLALKVSGREMEDVQAFKVGDMVEVGYKVTSREYNGNWYNDVSLYNIRPGAQQPAAQARPAQPQQAQIFPDRQEKPVRTAKGARAVQAAPAAGNGFGAADLDPAQHGDDLPF